MPRKAIYTEEERKAKARASVRKWQKANTEKIRVSNKEWRKANPEKAKAGVKRWKEANPEKVKTILKRWKEANPEGVKRWKLANPEKVKASIKRWKEENPEKVRKWRLAHKDTEKYKKINMHWQKKNPEKYIKNQREYTAEIYKDFNSGDRIRYWKRRFRVIKESIKKRPKLRGTQTDITAEFLEKKFLEQDKKCPYLNLELYFRDNFHDSGLAPSVDRKDPNKGYTKDNVEIVSLIANTAKYQMSKDLFLKFCKAIVNKKVDDSIISELHKASMKKRFLKGNPRARKPS